MPRSPEQNQHIRDERREQILKAGLTIFAQKGVKATKISDIAAACDLSYGLIYHYFHDKEELFYALVERAMQGALRLTADILGQPGSAWERLRLLCTEMIAGIRETPEYFRIMLQAEASEPQPSAVHALLSRYSPQIWGNVTTLIRLAQEDGQVVAGDANELAFLLSAVISGLSLSQSFGFDVFSVFPSVEAVLRFLRPSLPLEEESRHAD
jgi:AcrR family transcriptional regulator